MGKAAAKRVTTTVDPVETKIDQVASFAIKQQFLGAALNLGWRLVITFIVPVVAGSWLDDRFNSSPSYTLTGLTLAITASVMVIMRTVKEVNSEMPKVKKGSKND